jgi:molecular chaperone GrpE
MALDDFSMPESLPAVLKEQQPSEFFEGSEEQSLLGRFADVVEEVAALRQTIEERLIYDRVKEEAFDRLYAEVEEVRQDRAFQQVRPLLIDLLLLYDRVEQGLQQMYGPGVSLGSVTQLLQSIRDELLEVLYRREVETIVAPTAIFDRTLQQAVSVQPTAVASEHNQVVRVVRRGFRYRNRILRSEEVIVSSYKAN